MDDGIFTHKFWKATAERVVRAGAVAASASLIGDGVGFFGLNWGDIASLSLLAMVGSLLLSLAGSRVGTSSDPSFLK